VALKEEEDPFVCLCRRGRDAERCDGANALLVRPRVKAGLGLVVRPRVKTQKGWGLTAPGKRAALADFV